MTRSKGKDRRTGTDFFLRAFLLLCRHYDQVEPVNNLEDLMDDPVQCVFQEPDFNHRALKQAAGVRHLNHPVK